MVTGESCTWSGMPTVGTVGACYACTTGSFALGCTDATDGTVAFAEGVASSVSIVCTWVTGVVVSGTVSGTKPCGNGVGKMSILGFELSLIRGIMEG